MSSERIDKILKLLSVWRSAYSISLALIECLQGVYQRWRQRFLSRRRRRALWWRRRHSAPWLRSRRRRHRHKCRSALPPSRPTLRTVLVHIGAIYCSYSSCTFGLLYLSTHVLVCAMNNYFVSLFLSQTIFTLSLNRTLDAPTECKDRWVLITPLLGIGFLFE